MKAAVLLIALVFISGCVSQPAPQSQQPLKIGAILILTGPAAIWGEDMRNGMELAKRDLAAQGVNVAFVYEDSAGSAAQGLAAYRKLKDVDDVDVVFSAFSRVSIPLIPLADEDKTPLVMTLVSAEGAAAQSPYAFRFFSTARQYVDPHFDSVLTKERYGKIASLYINDEYGVSVNSAIKERASSAGIELVAEEAFEVNSADFRTQLAKIDAAGAEALLFVGAAPVEVVNAAKQFRELSPQADFFEASVLLSVEQIRGDAGADGAFTNAFPFTLGRTGAEFRDAYREAYGEEPLFTAALAYDMVRLAAEAGRNATSGEDIAENIIALRTFQSLNGPLEIKLDGEINPPLYVVQIVNDSLVPVA